MTVPKEFWDKPISLDMYEATLRQTLDLPKSGQYPKMDMGNEYWPLAMDAIEAASIGLIFVDLLREIAAMGQPIKDYIDDYFKGMEEARQEYERKRKEMAG
jgi:hypothetical protein